MGRQEISGMVKELDEAMEHVAETRKPPRIKVWKRKDLHRGKKNEQIEYFDEPEEEQEAEEEQGAEELRDAAELRDAEELRDTEELQREESRAEAARSAEISTEDFQSEEFQSEEFQSEESRQERPNSKWSFTDVLRPSDSLMAAFFAPMILLIAIFALKGIYPFGDETFLRMDMYHQYAPFFSEFRHKLTEGESLFYSWNIGMGVNFTALYAYYLASPMNWLLILCPQDYVIEFMTGLIVLKTGLASLSFTWYLRQQDREVRFGACYFGIFYAMSGYMAAYSWNIMWLDCIWLFPLIMRGLEKLVKEKKGLLYGVSLGLSILSNYYISIMICIFMVIYYFCLLILEDRKRLTEYFASAVRFAFYSLLAGGLAAIVLLPEIAALRQTASGNFSFPKSFEQYFPILDMLARHIGNVQTETGLDHWPNIYCSVAVYLFFLLYLACKKISVREKAVYCGLLLFFFASFSTNILNFVWHGFHYPNSLPCRQSFIYIFLMLVICYRAYQHLDDMGKKPVAAAFWVSAGFVLWAQQRLTEDEAYHFTVFYGAIIILALYTGLIYFYKNIRNSLTTAAVLAIVLVSAEAALNMAVTSVTTTGRNAYQGDNRAIRMQTEALLSEAEANGGFFRFEHVDARTKNDGAWMNFPSVSLFSSLAHADMTAFFKKVGCEGSTNAYSVVGSTPVTDSLFSIRYSVYNGVQENPRLQLRSSRDEIYVYENPYTLPVGFLLPDVAENSWKLDMETPADVQNQLAVLLNAPEPFETVWGEEDGSTFSFTAETDGEYYVSVTNKKVDAVSVVKGDSKKTVKNVNRGFLVEVGYLKAGETVTLENKDGYEDLRAVAYRFCIDGLKGIYESLNANPLQITVWEEDTLEGTIEAGNGGTLFLSIPYDEGWEIRVNGLEAEQKKIWDAFTGVELPAGTHTVTLRYVPRGLKEGALITAAAAALVLLSLAGSHFSRKRKEREIDGEEWD